MIFLHHLQHAKVILQRTDCMKMFAKMPTDMLKMHQKALGGRAPPGPAGGALKLPRPPSHNGGPTSKGRGGEREPPKLLLNRGPSEPCYATGL